MQAHVQEKAFFGVVPPEKVFEFLGRSRSKIKSDEIKAEFDASYFYIAEGNFEIGRGGNYKFIKRENFRIPPASLQRPPLEIVV